MVEESENVHVVFIANVDNLGFENVFMLKTVTTVFYHFVGIRMIADAKLNCDVDRFHC